MVSVTGSDVTSVSPSCDAVVTTVNVPSPRSGSVGSSVIDQAPVVSSISVVLPNPLPPCMDKVTV